MKNLARQLRAAELDKRQHREHGAPRSTYATHGERALGPHLLRRRARSNIRAATRRQLRQEQAEVRTEDPTQRRRSPTRTVNGKRFESDAWQRYRREGEAWKPPPPLAEPKRAGKSASSRARARKRKQEREAQCCADRLPLPDFGAPLPGAAPTHKRVRATPRTRHRPGRHPEHSSAASQREEPTPTFASPLLAPLLSPLGKVPGPQARPKPCRAPPARSHGGGEPVRPQPPPAAAAAPGTCASRMGPGSA